MTKLKFGILAGVLFVGFFSFAAQPDLALAQARFSQHADYDVPDGQGNVLLFETGATSAPLQNLRFIFGGTPELKIHRIVGLTAGDPSFEFNPPAAPHEVTVHFAQNPFGSASISFEITVNNLADGVVRHTVRLTVVAIWE